MVGLVPPPLHWFLIRFEVAPGLCFLHNSLGGHAEEGLREGVVATLNSLTTRHWSPVVGHSDQQLDGHSCALFILRNIFILGLGPPPGVVLQPVGWPTFFRIHWLALLFQTGVRSVDPSPD